MKYGLYLLLIIGLVIGAYQTAQNKLHRPLELSSIQLGMKLKEVEKMFGSPSAQSRNQFTYILHDGSELTVSLRDEKVSNAKVKFHRAIKIQDPQMKALTLVQMDGPATSGKASWFFAGKPEEGLIYKITSEGLIESLTWVPPFSYGGEPPKQLQALLRDFKTQRSL